MKAGVFLGQGWGIVLASLLAACDQPETSVTAPIAEPVTVTVNSAEVNRIPASRQFNIGNTNYLFDVSNHSLEELQALLQRVDEISRSDMIGHEDLEIVMILHGPDIEWFRQENYEQNRQLIDLAARLDSYAVIDMKVCEVAMDTLGVRQEELPPFIEPVPYAPDELKRLTDEGYINL